jgi:hypothetical protein
MLKAEMYYNFFVISKAFTVQNTVPLILKFVSVYMLSHPKDFTSFSVCKYFKFHLITQRRI